MTELDARIVIVGGGLAGLACARALAADGVECRVLEAADRVGGRVRTDVVDGFRLDRGFQVHLTAYPEARRVLDPAALDLRPFHDGALVQLGGRRHRVADPWRHPLEGLRGAFAPVFRLGDLPRLARLRARARRPGAAAAPGTTAEHLERLGFSPPAIDRFFRPFFGGIFLERDLATPARQFQFVFGMFSAGHAVLPRDGMQAIPDQLAAALPGGTVHTDCRVMAVSDGGVRLDDGRIARAEQVVLATDPTTAGGLFGEADRGWNGGTTLSFAAERSPLGEPILVLDGDGTGPVNHACVPSDVQSSYAPPGAALVSATVIGVPAADDTALEAAARSQLGGWFGPDVSRWRLLRIDRVAHALPRMAADPDDRPALRPRDGMVRAGDALVNPSINGALVSGRLAAEAVRDAAEAPRPGTRP